MGPRGVYKHKGFLPLKTTTGRQKVARYPLSPDGVLVIKSQDSDSNFKVQINLKLIIPPESADQTNQICLFINDMQWPGPADKNRPLQRSSPGVAVRVPDLATTAPSIFPPPGRLDVWPRAQHLDSEASGRRFHGKMDGLFWMCWDVCFLLTKKTGGMKNFEKIHES